MISIILLQCLGTLLLGLLYLILFVGRRGRNFPPGPPTLPLVGNLHQLPKTGAHFKFTEWAQQYGGIFSLKIGPATAVVISSPSIIKELIDKKSAIYSNRPPSYVGDLISHGNHLVLMDNGERWRLLRKLIHQYFNETRCEKEHLAIQNAEAVQMLRDFCVEPDQMMLHPMRFSNSIIMSLIYGIRSPTSTTSHVVKLSETMEEFSNLMEVGATPPVDIIPVLKWIPERFFGNWITRSRNLRGMMKDLFGGLHSQVIQRRLTSSNRTSFLDGILDQQEKLQFTPDQLNFLCGNLLEGGSDTSSNTILAFIQAMIKYPDVQKKAQQQIDSFIGDDRSPLWSDYANLPYIAMVVKETMRWRPTAPLAIPHYSTKDDTINNLFIPKNTTIVLNVWGIHHDPTIFPQPHTFSPTNFHDKLLPASDYAVAPDFRNRDHFGYGSGRRICPGIHLAERNLWLAIAKLLWAFEFATKVDETGEVVEVDVDPRGYRSGVLLAPRRFEADVKVRGERRKTILREFESVEGEVFWRFGG